MSDLRKAVAEDLRRFGLVLIGAGALANIAAAGRIFAFAVGFILLGTAYIILWLPSGETDDDHKR